jgi:hypothetical protein
MPKLLGEAITGSHAPDPTFTRLCCRYAAGRLDGSVLGRSCGSRSGSLNSDSCFAIGSEGTDILCLHGLDPRVRYGTGNSHTPAVSEPEPAGSTAITRPSAVKGTPVPVLFVQLTADVAIVDNFPEPSTV